MSNLSYPSLLVLVGVSIDADGNVIVAEQGAHRIRKIEAGLEPLLSSLPRTAVGVLRSDE